MAGYQIKNLGLSVSQYDMLKRLELSQEGLLALKRYCGKKGIIFLATPHTESAVDFLGPLMPAYKVASADLTNLPLLRKISRKKKPMILSTGMSTLAEIKQAVAAVRKEGNNSFILLHCTSAYPCPLQEVNLKAMQTIRKKYNCLVGYSDHTLGNTVAIMAVAMGAVVLEKHLTLDKDLPGPDHKASLEPGEFKELVSAIRDAEKSMGCGIKKPSAGEVRIAKSVRKSLVAAVDIPKGAKISRDMLCIKRPGSGIAPGQLNKAIGRKAASNIIKDTPLTWQKLKR
jgi:sialic acid synthase SpsE